MSDWYDVTVLVPYRIQVQALSSEEAKHAAIGAAGTLPTGNIERLQVVPVSTEKTKNTQPDGRQDDHGETA